MLVDYKIIKALFKKLKNKKRIDLFFIFCKCLEQNYLIVTIQHYFASSPTLYNYDKNNFAIKLLGIPPLYLVSGWSKVWKKKDSSLGKRR